MIYPLKPFQTAQFIVVLAMLLAFQLVLRKLVISLPAFRTVIAFSWMPVMVAGWIFGPVYGFIFGAITDTVGYLLHPGIWYFYYAIQEPVVGLIAGLIGSLFRCMKHVKNYLLHLLIHQIVLMSSMLFCLLAIFYWYAPPHVAKNVKIPKILSFSSIYLATGLVFLYGLEFELMTLYFWKFKREILLQYLYASMVVIVVIFLWSFLLGPKIAIKFFQYANGRVPKAIKEFGPIFYLIPRIIKEGIASPIKALLLTLIIYAIEPIFNNMCVVLQNSYHAETSSMVHKLSWRINSKNNRKVDPT